MNKLTEIRKKRKLRMVDIALKSGVGVSTVWLIEHGYIVRVSNRTKRKIAKGLGLKVEDIFPEGASQSISKKTRRDLLR